jgi:hypothetical protein
MMLKKHFTTAENALKSVQISCPVRLRKKAANSSEVGEGIPQGLKARADSLALLPAMNPR